MKGVGFYQMNLCIYFVLYFVGVLVKDHKFVFDLFRFWFGGYISGVLWSSSCSRLEVFY